MTTAPTLPPRLEFLRSQITPDSGEWTPGRVEALYLAYLDPEHRAPKHTTHAADLERLHRMGLLDQHETRKGRHYTPRGTA